VGTHVQHVTRRTVTETDNVLFTTMTMNPAPMHLDTEYVARSEFGRPLVNSMFTAALVAGLSVAELTLGTIIAQVALSDVQFRVPVSAGDTIRVETEVVEARRSRSRSWCRTRRLRAPRVQPARRPCLPRGWHRPLPGSRTRS
jgi:acyl dehydratase